MFNFITRGFFYTMTPKALQYSPYPLQRWCQYFQLEHLLQQVLADLKKNGLMSEMYIEMFHFLHEKSLIADHEDWTVDKTFKDTGPFIVYGAKIEHLLMSQLWQTGFHSSFDLFKPLRSAPSYWNKYNQVITTDTKLMQRWIKPRSFFHFTVEIGHRQRIL